MIFIPDAVGYWLTGVARAERTIASTSGLLTATTGEWDDEIFEVLDLPRRLALDLIEPGECHDRGARALQLERHRLSEPLHVLRGPHTAMCAVSAVARPGWRR